MDVKNHPSTIVVTVALITSFGANRGRIGGRGGDKDVNKSDTIVSLHLVDDSDNNSDDNDKAVKSFESDYSNNGETNNDNKYIADKPVTTSELENDITGGGVTGNDDNNDDNSVDNDDSDDTSNEGSIGDASNSEDKSTTSVTNTDENYQDVLWVSVVAMANKNVEKGINSNIVDSSPHK